MDVLHQDVAETAVAAPSALKSATIGDGRAALATGRTSLFLGAGPSCALGGPSWSQLEAAIVNEFVDSSVRAEIQARGWWDLMDFVCETLDRRAPVEAFIRGKLEHIGVEPWFEQLLQAPWERVYTTNYDDVAARANDISKSGLARFESYYGGRLPYNPVSTERPVIKLMGDVHESYPSKGAMILCRSDLSLNVTAEAYRTTVQALRDDIDAGVNVVVLGQSLEDRILVSVLTDIVRTRGSKPAGKLFLVSKRPPRWDIQLALAKLEPKFIEATAQQLTKELAGVEGPLPPERGLRVKIKGHPVNLGPHVLRLLDETGYLVDTTSAGTQFSGAEDFLARSAYSKEAFDRNWDFKRR